MRVKLDRSYKLWFFCELLLQLSLGVLSISCTLIAIPVRAQTIPPAQIPNPVLPTPPQPQIPEPLLPPEQLLEISPTAPTTPQQLPNLPETFKVSGFEFGGNTVFDQKQLEAITKEFVGEITFAQLLQAVSKITELYIREGYITSGAYIPEQTLAGGIVKIQIVEGSLEEIRVTRQPGSSRRLNNSYVRSRLAIATGKPLNIRRLREALQLLQQDPLIASISAELSAGTKPGTNLLEVKIEEADSFSARIIADNSKSPSVGSFRRGLEIEQANLSGLGDNLRVAYNNTDGSNEINTNYTVPINPRNGTISLSYNSSWSNIIEPPFDKLDIESNSRTYEVSVRQPIVRNANQEFTQELALGLTGSRRESDSSLSGVGFPISLGADAQGNTRISALRFFQDWIRRSPQQVVFARSQFSFGVGAFDATINEEAPDSRFFAWRGQVLWLRLLTSETDAKRQVSPRVLVRSDVQLANRALLPLEQFTVGGISSVRGYRQDALFSDNGVFLSAELQWPIYNTNRGQNVLQIIPFVDFGTTWNSSGKPNPDPNTLASVGLGLQWQMGEQFKARLDYGIPLVDINSGNRTWQEKGLYFSLQYNPF